MFVYQANYKKLYMYVPFYTYMTDSKVANSLATIWLTQY